VARQLVDRSTPADDNDGSSRGVPDLLDNYSATLLSGKRMREKK